MSESERLMSVAAALAAGDPVDWSEKLHRDAWSCVSPRVTPHLSRPSMAR